jgi:8-oxo-dGTP diphosphatase
MIRRFDEAPAPGIKYKIRHGVYAIIRKNASLLITHQAPPDDEFQLPGGGVDPGESPLQTLHREVMEETGWRVAPVVKLGIFQRFVFMPDYDMWAQKMCHIYVCDAVRCYGDPTEAAHTAVFTDAFVAADILDNTGDRYFVNIAQKKRLI